MLIDVHTVFQSVPNQPRITFATPWIVVTQLLKVFFAYSQTFAKMPFTASQQPSQSPLNSAMKKSTTPRMWFVTAVNVLLICWKAPSNTGARNSHRAFHTVLIAALTLSNVMPMPPRRSFSPSMNPPTVAWISFQIPMMVVRKPSFVFHRCINAATRAATTATTASTGADTPARATFTAARPVFISLNAFTTFLTVLITLETPRISGPIAATTPATVRIVFFVSSSAAAKAAAHS